MPKKYSKAPSGLHKTGNQFFNSTAHGIGSADNRKKVRRKERLHVSCLTSEKTGKGGMPTSNVHKLADRMSNKIRLSKKSFFNSRKQR